jgi:hypothetical protein
MKLIVAAAISLVSIQVAAMPPYKQLPSLDELRAAINSEGAHEVLWNGLWAKDSGQVFDAFVEKVALGDVEWLTLAGRLKPVSDAGASEGLDGALSGALLHNPSATLNLSSLIDSPRQFSIASICSGRFYLWAEEPVEKARKWYEDARNAVSNIKLESLAAKRNACLAVIQESSKRFEELLSNDGSDAIPHKSE